MSREKVDIEAIKEKIEEIAASKEAGTIRPDTNKLTIDGIKELMICCYNNLPQDYSIILNKEMDLEKLRSITKVIDLYKFLSKALKEKGIEIHTEMKSYNSKVEKLDIKCSFCDFLVKGIRG